jgi:ligand-binding sensor domain-containing protein
MSGDDQARANITRRRRAARGRAVAAAVALAPLLALLLAGCGAQAGAWRLLTPVNSHVISLATDPNIPELVYAGSDDGAVYRARADQRGNAAPGAGIPSDAVVASILPDPKVPGRLLAGTTEGLYRSDHYGDNWAAFGRGLPTNFATIALAAAPDDSVLLAGTDSHGIYRSLDDGATWTAASAGMPAGATVTAVVWDATGKVWWAGLAAPQQHTLYKSTDGGQNWTPADQFVKAGADINALAAVPSATGSDTVFAATSAGIYTYNGEKWAAASGTPANQAALAVTAIPHQPGAIVAAFTSGVYVSTDGGATWTVVAQGLTKPVSGLGVARDANGANVYFAASGQLARFPTGISGSNANTDQTSALLVALIAAMLVGGGYLISRRSRRFGYAMGASDNEGTAGPGAAAARARERARGRETAGMYLPNFPPPSGRKGARGDDGAAPRVLTPDDLTTRKQTGKPVDSDKASSNGHGDPNARG